MVDFFQSFIDVIQLKLKDSADGRVRIDMIATSVFAVDIIFSTLPVCPQMKLRYGHVSK